MKDIYIFKADPNSSTCIRLGGARYGNQYFVGRTMISDWIVPEIEISNKSKKLKDVVTIMGCGAVAMSKEALNALGHLLAIYAEALPIGVIKNRELFALNVIQCGQYIDWDQSNATFHDPERIRPRSVSNIVFKKDLDPELLMFKDSVYTYPIFVSRAFVTAVRESDLVGAGLS